MFLDIILTIESVSVFHKTAQI